MILRGMGWNYSTRMTQIVLRGNCIPRQMHFFKRRIQDSVGAPSSRESKRQDKRHIWDLKIKDFSLNLSVEGKALNWQGRENGEGGGGGERFQLLKMTVHAKICYDFLKLKVSKRFQVDYSKFLRQGARKENIYLYKCLG